MLLHASFGPRGESLKKGSQSTFMITLAARFLTSQKYVEMVGSHLGDLTPTAPAVSHSLQSLFLRWRPGLIGSILLHGRGRRQRIKTFTWHSGSDRRD